MYYAHNIDAYEALPPESRPIRCSYISSKWKAEAADVKARYNKIAKKYAGYRLYYALNERANVAAYHAQPPEFKGPNKFSTYMLCKWEAEAAARVIQTHMIYTIRIPVVLELTGGPNRYFWGWFC